MLQDEDEASVTDLQTLRAEVDRTDDALLALLVKRVRLARSIGELKRDQGMALVDERREEEIKSRLAAQAGPATDPLDARAVRRLWDALLVETRRIVSSLPPS
jgi:chorismate mutase